MKNKILIKNGLLFDGSADKKAEIHNVLIENAIVQKISKDAITVDENTRVINAMGKWITPGFIDSHTHYDGELLASPGLKESARHGVTTIILGSCSVSAIYNDAEDTSDTFTRVEAIPREAMLPLLEKCKTWSTAKEWVDFIEALPLGVNVASYVGHSDLRSGVMGMERSLSLTEKATKEERNRMNTLLNEALDEGFLGLSTMDNPWDKMDGDKYWSKKTPSFYSSWKERKNLVKTLRDRDGILQGAPNLVTRVNALKYMMISSGILRKPIRTTMIAMMDLIADRYILPLVIKGAAFFNRFLNADFRMQSPPTPFTVYYDGADSVMFEEFPSGEAMRHLAKNLEERNELIKGHEFRQKFKAEIKKQFAPKVWHRDLSIAYILNCPDESLVGRNFYEIAEEQKKHPVDVFLDLIYTYDKDIRWTTTIANDRVEKYSTIYNYPYNLISFSDAGAHLRNMAFYNFPLQMIRYVTAAKNDGSEIMSMEKCIWRLTGEQADWFGLDCGYIREGSIADINIIDPKHISNVVDGVEEAPIQEFDNFMRMVNRNPKVVSQVIVGGKTIFEEDDFVEGYGKHTKYGRFLRSKIVKGVKAANGNVPKEHQLKTQKIRL